MPVSYRFLTRPAGDGAVLLADLPALPWGLFETTANTGESVSKRLAALIESGKRYPPAFARSYEAALRNLLSRQHEAPYLMAPHLTNGEWYWVLEISGSPPKLSWVSDDFAVQTGKITEFDLTGQQLKRLGYAG
jgi:hypothetical protein